MGLVRRLFKRDRDVNETIRISKITSPSNELVESQTKSCPAQKGLVRAKQNAFEENTILVGYF